MQILGIELVKQRDGAVVLRATREDGSRVWQKQEGAHAGFFPLHDITHYAVETVLAIHDAFLGLLAAGWSIEETEGKSARGPLPLNAQFVEAVVGTLDAERASATRRSEERRVGKECRCRGAPDREKKKYNHTT